MTQPSLADQRPRTAAVPDEIDHVHARLAELRELKLARHAAQRGLVVRVCLFDIRHQPVEVDVGIDLAQRVAVVVLRVDLEDLHDQRADVLDVQVQRDRLIGPELRFVR